MTPRNPASPAGPEPLALPDSAITALIDVVEHADDEGADMAVDARRIASPMIVAELRSLAKLIQVVTLNEVAAELVRNRADEIEGAQ